MNEELIQDEIECLETAEFSYSNVEKLAALYIVREHLKNPLERKFDGIAAELDDIVPSYKRYCDTKRRYQLNEVTIDAQILAMRNLCQEIKEFILSLYSGTETRNERQLIHNMLDEVQGTI